MMKSTPNLTNEFHPVPKVYKGSKPKSHLGPGKKTTNSLDAVEKFKKVFFAWGITECEWVHSPCWKKNGLTFAHEAKRRKLTAEDVKDPRKVALVCIQGHIVLEQMPADEMKKTIQDIVKKREAKLGLQYDD